MTPVLPRGAGARWAPALRTLGDERLARLAQDGSDAAFAAIYGRYAPVLHGYCRGLLRDEDEAGDALQNTMLKALQALRRRGLAGPLRPWLFRIAHNEAVTIIRHRAKRPGELPAELVAVGADAHRQVAARESLAQLLDGLQGLTAHQRGAIVMRELGGLSYDEVAGALDTSPLAARQAVFAARRKLAAGTDFAVLLPTAPLSAAAFFAAVGGGGAAAGAGVAGAVGSAGGMAAAGELFSGIAGGTAAKTVAGLLATASLGVGSAELAHRRPADSSPEQRAAVAGPATTGAAEAGERCGGTAAREGCATTDRPEGVAAPTVTADAAVAVGRPSQRDGAALVARQRRPAADRAAGGDGDAGPARRRPSDLWPTGGGGAGRHGGAGGTGARGSAPGWSGAGAGRGRRGGGTGGGGTERGATPSSPRAGDASGADRAGAGGGSSGWGGGSPVAWRTGTGTGAGSPGSGGGSPAAGRTGAGGGSSGWGGGSLVAGRTGTGAGSSGWGGGSPAAGRTGAGGGSSRSGGGTSSAGRGRDGSTGAQPTGTPATDPASASAAPATDGDARPTEAVVPAVAAAGSSTASEVPDG